VHLLRPTIVSVRRLSRRWRALLQVGICDDCLTDCVMRRFSEVKHQRVAQLARDTYFAAEIVKLRDQARRDERDPPNCELRTRDRAKRGLPEDTPLHDVTRRASPLL
jgi:hypothetical protein